MTKLRLQAMDAVTKLKRDEQSGKIDVASFDSYEQLQPVKANTGELKDIGTTLMDHQKKKM